SSPPQTNMNDQVVQLITNLNQEIVELQKQLQLHVAEKAKWDEEWKELMALLLAFQSTKNDTQKETTIKTKKETKKPNVPPAPAPVSQKSGDGSSSADSIHAPAAKLSYAKTAAKNLAPQKPKRLKVSLETIQRTFTAPSGPSAYTFVYLSCRHHLRHSQVRQFLGVLKVQQSCVIDIQFPTHGTIALLVHTNYKNELVGLLTQNKVPVKPAFDPMNAEILGDSKLASGTITEPFLSTTESHLRLPQKLFEQYLQQRRPGQLTDKPAPGPLTVADFQDPDTKSTPSDADLTMEDSSRQPVELFELCSQNSVDILLVTETFLSKGKIPSCPWKQIHNYGQVISRVNCRGGLSFFIRPDFPYPYKEYPITNPDTLSIGIGQYTLHGLYLPPKLDLETARQRYSTLPLDEHTLILRDFNTRLGRCMGDTCVTPHRQDHFEAWLDDHGLTLWNVELAYGVNTFEGDHRRSIINYFILNEPQFLLPKLVIRDEVDLLRSDHYLCEFSFLPATDLPTLPPTDAACRQWRLQRLSDPKVKERYVNLFEE
ncbi:hypothetical protein EC973_007628, partial [Apophysomyces ossiformis]